MHAFRRYKRPFCKAKRCILQGDVYGIDIQ